MDGFVSSAFSKVVMKWEELGSVRLPERLSDDNSLQYLPPWVWAQLCLPQMDCWPSLICWMHSISCPINTSWMAHNISATYSSSRTLFKQECPCVVFFSFLKMEVVYSNCHNSKRELMLPLLGSFESLFLKISHSFSPLSWETPSRLMVLSSTENTMDYSHVFEITSCIYCKNNLNRLSK